MDIGIDRKSVKGKPGLYVYFYTSQQPKVYTVEPTELTAPISAEKLCVRMFKDEENFRIDEKERRCPSLTTTPTTPSTEDEHARIYPGTMHLFQLWDCQTKQYKAPNDEIQPSELSSCLEFVLRIRFKYPPSLEQHNFNDVWDTGAFYYYFVQCRHDFIHDALHDIYHCHIKEDLCIGLALVDMCRLAFEKGHNLKQLKDKYEYLAFLPRHVARKIKNLFMRITLHKSSRTALDDTYDSFYSLGTNPHRNSVVSYLKKLLPSVPEYASEEFTVKNHVSRSTKCVVHPYNHKSSGIYMDLGKGNLEPVGTFANLTAIDVREDAIVLLHFTNSKPQALEFVEEVQARSFVSMLDGYYRLMFDYHYSLSNQIYSPIVKLWNELKCYGPLSKEYMKVIWRRNASSVSEGSFLIKQRSTSFDDFVIIVHKMGRNFPAIPIVYNSESQSYSCDELTMKQVFHSHHRPISFSSVKELIRYYRQGDFIHLKLTTQLSPIPKEEMPLMICRDRTHPIKEIQHSPSVDLDSIDMPILLQPNSVQRGKNISQPHHGLFNLMEGTYSKEKVVIREVKSNLPNREILTMFFQRDVQKILKWKHEMIVRLYGLCLSPFYVMSQRMVEGRLNSLLHRRSESVQIYHCVRATAQLAQALVYLEHNGFTHGAIRCKNVLVSRFDAKDIEIKLAGDMLSSYMSSLPLTDRLNFERLPWIALERWTNLADERIESDVYSFGMTIWEIFSYGQRPFSDLHSIEEVKSSIESGRSIAVPSTIESFRTHLHEYSDSAMQNQFRSLIEVLYEKIIRTNISPDPSTRMKPQDILKELILLDSQFSPEVYEHLQADHAPSRSASDGVMSSHSADSLSPVHTPSTTSSSPGNRRSSPMSNSCNEIADRPLPSIPLSTPPSQPHIIDQQDLIGFQDNTATKLGQGFYGEVFLCKLLQRGGRPPILCAVKKLVDQERDDEAAEKSIIEYEREVKMMVLLNHQNIVRMYGECYYTFPDGREKRMIVMEYIKCGNLSHFVKNKGVLLGVQEKLLLYKKFALDVAEGMLFLHSLNPVVIHRDLAARNVLITEKPHRAKITDFGLSRVLTDQDYYKSHKGAPLPLLWCPPESMLDYKFTKASDVWSYAVLVWEMYSCGKQPFYPKVKLTAREGGFRQIDPESLAQVVSSSGPGTRLPKQPDLSSDMYNLMMRCWHKDPNKRPSFEAITNELKTMWLS